MQADTVRGIGRIGTNSGLLAVLCGLLLLAGCGGVQQLPADVVQYSWHWRLPAMLLLQVEPDNGVKQDYLLVLQDEDGVLRASLFDPAGMPVARKQLHHGRWRNEGLLSPKPAVENWLTAIVSKLTAGLPPDSPDVIQLQLADGSRLHISQMEQP